MEEEEAKVPEKNAMGTRDKQVNKDIEGERSQFFRCF